MAWAFVVQVLRNSIRENSSPLRNAPVVFATDMHSQVCAVHFFHQLHSSRPGASYATMRAVGLWPEQAGIGRLRGVVAWFVDEAWLWPLPEPAVDCGEVEMRRPNAAGTMSRGKRAKVAHDAENTAGTGGRDLSGACRGWADRTKPDVCVEAGDG